ncbi:MAG: tetratricopeptide repeat protein [Planctomycetaceae bacterium]
MSARSILVAAVVLLLAVTSVAVWWNTKQADEVTPQVVESPLDQLRELTIGIIEGAPQERSIISRKAGIIAKELQAIPGPNQAAAKLYYVALQPLANLDPELAAIPPVDEVRLMSTQDLQLLARLLFHSGRNGPAEQLVTLALEREDSRDESLRIAILIRMELGQDADVMQHTEELVLLAPEDPRPYRVQMMVHRNHGRWDNLVQSAERAVALTHPTDWVLQVELIDAYTRLGRTADARREFDRLEAARPDLIPRAPVMHARLLLQEGNAEACEAIIRKYLNEDPEDPEGLLMLGKLQLAASRIAEAVLTFQKVLTVDPSESEAYYQLGLAEARLEHHDLAREYLARHRVLLDAKIKVYAMEQQAAREPYNVEIRTQLAQEYQELGLPELSDFWQRAAASIADEVSP